MGLAVSSANNETILGILFFIARPLGVKSANDEHIKRQEDSTPMSFLARILLISVSQSCWGCVSWGELVAGDDDAVIADHDFSSEFRRIPRSELWPAQGCLHVYYG